MTDKEIEILVELTAMKSAKAVVCEFKPNFEFIANKAAEVAMEKARIERKRDIDLHIDLHKAQCDAKKYTSVKSLVSACVGGMVVAVINWIIKKF